LLDEVLRAGEADVDEGTVFEGAVSGEDGAYDFGALGRYLPQEGVRVADEVGVREVGSLRDDDGRAFEIAPDEHIAVEGPPVPGKLGDPYHGLAVYVVSRLHVSSFLPTPKIPYPEFRRNLEIMNC
jgi:hypothetical protein